MGRRTGQALPNRARIAEQQAEALRLRLAGWTVRRIADHLHVSETTAWGRLDAAMADLVNPLAEQMRVIEGARLDALQAAHWDAAVSGKNLRAAEYVLRLIDRRAKLFALDGPIEVNVTETDQTDIALLELVREAQARNAVTRTALGAAPQ